VALDRPVALKAIAPQFAQDAAFRERFQRESRLAASIEHPNVIPVYEAGELDDLLYLIMRWVDGTDLRARLDDCGRLAPAHALRILIPVAQALAAAHRRGLIHRDIKPANVLISRGDGDEEHVYLTDFGIARRADGAGTMTRTGVLVGTLDYTAPERIEGGKGDVASDIYAFGCMLYETLTGAIPFDRPTELTKMHAHLNDPVPSAHEKAPDVPASLDAVIAKAMAKRPESRYGSAEELATALTASRQELETGEHELRAPSARPDTPTDETVVAGARPVADGATVVEDASTRVTRSDTQLDDRPATSVRERPRRRVALVAVPLALLVLIGVLVAVLTSGGSGGHPAASAASPPTTSTASVPSAATSSGAAASTASPSGGLRVVRTLTLPGPPRAVAADQSSGRVWVTGDGYVTMEPGNVTTRFNGTPSAIAAGNDQLWISDPTAGQLHHFTISGGRLTPAQPISADASHLAIDARDGSVWMTDSSGRVGHAGLNGQLTQLGSVTPAPVDVAFGEGPWMWTVNGNALVRIDPRGSPPQSFHAGPNPVSVTLNLGVWIGHGFGHVTRFNPATLRLNANRPVASPSGLDMIAAVERAPAVWAASARTQTVYRIDYLTQRVTGEVALPSTPVDLAVTPGVAWVATQDDKLIEIRA
jgi:serine/threonine-protein kinase